MTSGTRRGCAARPTTGSTGTTPRGINAGEALYATNYNIKEKAGSSTADGVIDAADAQRMFPQGHGDAYGHYLTALTGYYRLLANPNFTWTPRAEAVTGARSGGDGGLTWTSGSSPLPPPTSPQTAEQICALTYRQQYKDGPAAGWSQYRDSRRDTQHRRRSATGASMNGPAAALRAPIYHWVVGNAMLPDVDTIHHTGVQKIDRTTVPELNELATPRHVLPDHRGQCQRPPQSAGPQSRRHRVRHRLHLPRSGLDRRHRRQCRQGMGHYEQIYERAMKALNNAAGAFHQAARMTRCLRNQENQVDDFNTAIVDQERAYRNQLIEIYGTPYEGDIGPGKTYAQGYDGPDSCTGSSSTGQRSRGYHQASAASQFRVPEGHRLQNLHRPDAIASIYQDYACLTIRDHRSEDA